MNNENLPFVFRHASTLIALIGLTASVVTAYMINRAHIEDLQQRLTVLEQRFDRLTEHTR